MRVLAVDDDKNVLELLQVILSAGKHVKLETLISPMRALQTINRRISRFDCILLDIMMPEMDGVTLCQRIRANPRYRDTPIVMLTAKADKKSIKSAFASGASDFVNKPFDIHELTTRIRRAGAQSAAKNEIRALRYRAEIEKRIISAKSSSKLDADHNVVRSLRHQDKSESRHIFDNLEERKCTDNLTRNELVKLFSDDFSIHAGLHRRFGLKRAC